MHTSYFLFVMVITMFCYAVIKGRPSKLRQSNPEFCPEKVRRGWVWLAPAYRSRLHDRCSEIVPDRSCPRVPLYPSLSFSIGVMHQTA